MKSGREQGAVILAKDGRVGVGGAEIMGRALPRWITLASASTSSAILMSSISGADLLLSMWMSDKRVAVSALVTVPLLATEVAELLLGALALARSFFAG